MTRRLFLRALGLGALVAATNPTALLPSAPQSIADLLGDGTIGGITRSTYPFWASQQAMGPGQPLTEEILFRGVKLVASGERENVIMMVSSKTLKQYMDLLVPCPTE